MACAAKCTMMWRGEWEGLSTEGESKGTLMTVPKVHVHLLKAKRILSPLPLTQWPHLRPDLEGSESEPLLYMDTSAQVMECPLLVLRTEGQHRGNRVKTEATNRSESEPGASSYQLP